MSRVLLSLALAIAANPAAAQDASGRRFDHATSFIADGPLTSTFVSAPSILTPAFDAQSESAHTLQLVLGSSSGWLLGLLAGAAIGYGIQPDPGDSYVGAAEWWIGGLLGGSLGAPLGAHLANSRRGNLLHGILGSVAVVPLLFVATGGEGIILTPVAQVGVSVLVERRSSPAR